VTLPISKHRLWQVAVDAALIAAAWYLAFQLRFDKGVPIYYRTLFERSVGIVIVVQLVTFVCFGFYNRWWRYVSTRDMWGAARGVAVACVLSSLVLYFANLVPEVGLPRPTCPAWTRSAPRRGTSSPTARRSSSWGRATPAI